MIFMFDYKGQLASSTLIYNKLTLQIQKQVHPRLSIDDDAIEFLEMLVYQLLSRVCSIHPHSVGDIEDHIQSTFAYSVAQWALNEAHEKLERVSVRKRSGFAFPIDRIHSQLMKVEMGGERGRR